MPKVFPTVIFGAGGTGCRIVDRLQKMLKKSEQYKDLSDKMFVFGALDTSQMDLNSLSIPHENKVPISKNINSLKDYFINVEASGGKAARDKAYSSMMNWFGPASDTMFNHDLTKGAGQFRILSRAAWEAEMEIGGLSTRLDKVLEKVTDVDLNQYKIGNGIEVYVVSSMSGGTGAGSSLMLARYIRKYYGDKNIPCTIKGVLLMPEIFCHAPQGESFWPQLRANGYAYLKELEGLNKRQLHPELSQLNFTYPDGNVLPFDVAFLVDAMGETGRLKYEGGDYSNFEKFTAQALFTRLFCKGVSNKNLNAENNLISDLISGEAETTTLSKRFCSLGTSALVYPIDDTVKLLSERAVADLVNDDWGKLDNSFSRALDNFNKEIQMGNTNAKRPDRYEHFINSISEEVRRKDEGENFSAFMVSIHQDVVSRPNNKDIDQSILFIKEIQELMAKKISGVSKNHPGVKSLLGVYSLENAYEGGKSGLSKYLKKLQDNLKEADGIIRNELNSVLSSLLEDVVFAHSENGYSIFKYMSEKTLFGIRYFLSKVVANITLDAKNARKNFQEAELRMQELRDKKWVTSSGVEGSLDEYLAKEIPDELGSISKTFKTKKQKVVSDFFEEFLGFYNKWVAMRSEYTIWWLRDRLYNDLLKYLGEDSREGGLLGLIYSVTKELIKKTDRIEADFIRNADENPIAREQFENMTLVYGHKDDREKQLIEVNQELNGDLAFKRGLYQQLREILVGKWYELRLLEKDPSGEYEYKRKKSTLNRNTFEAVFNGLQSEAVAKVENMNCVDFDVLTACRKEAEKDGVEDVDEYLNDLIGTLQLNADVMMKLTAKNELKNLNYVVYNAQDDMVLEAKLKDVSSKLTNEPSTENDASFGKHVLLFSRSILCFNLRQIVGLIGEGAIAQRDYYSILQSKPVSPHLDKRFNRILEDFDTRFMDNMMLDMGFALIAGIIDMRDDVFYFEENGIWESLEAVGYDELQQVFQEKYLSNFKDMVARWRADLEESDSRKLKSEHELPILVKAYVSTEIEANKITSSNLAVIKSMRQVLKQWVEGR